MVFLQLALLSGFLNSGQPVLLFFSVSALESRAVEQFRVHAWVKRFKSSPVSSQHPLPEVTHSISEVLLGQMSIRDQGIKTVKVYLKKKKKSSASMHTDHLLWTTA